MDEDNEDNKIVDSSNSQDYEFKFNFVNTPWDDRTTKSKIGIVALLVAIFVATMACVIHNFIMHFSNTKYYDVLSLAREVKCNLVRMSEYTYATRIHSVETNELLCLGAMVSETSVLASSVCVKSGPVRLRVGIPSNPRCKKGFTVDGIEPIIYQGVVCKRLVLLTTYESMAQCGGTIILGDTLVKDSPAYIIGRPLVTSGRSLSRQQAKIVDVGKNGKKKMNLKNMICVTAVGKCPVRVGDFLVQYDRLFGLASTSSHVSDHSKVVCFTDLRGLGDEATKTGDVKQSI